MDWITEKKYDIAINTILVKYLLAMSLIRTLFTKNATYHSYVKRHFDIITTILAFTPGNFIQCVFDFKTGI